MKLRLELLEMADFPQIVEWVNGHDQDFLVQWAGLTYSYPLTVDQMASHYHKGINTMASDVFVYRIMDDETNRFIGTVQLCRFNQEKREAVIGRFLIGNDADRGRGIGKSALRKLVEIGFYEFGLETIKLNVFDFNSQAIQCYEGIGFVKNQVKENTYTSTQGLRWGNVEMILARERFLNERGHQR